MRKRLLILLGCLSALLSQVPLAFATTPAVSTQTHVIDVPEHQIRITLMVEPLVVPVPIITDASPDASLAQESPPIPIVVEVSLPATETIVQTPTVPASLPQPLPEAPAPLTYPAQFLVINEILAAPSSGGMEWVEIRNPQQNSVSLEGWQLRDASGRHAAFASEMLAPGSYALVEIASGMLNNGGDTLELLDPAEHVVDTLLYGTTSIPAPLAQGSIGRITTGAWERTEQPTPRAMNLFPAPESIIPPSTSASSASATTSGSSTSSTSSSSTSNGTSSSGSGSVANATQTPTVTIAPPSTGSVSIITAPTNGPAQLRLSEVYANTSGSDAEEEFIEIENLGSSAVDLIGWRVVDLSETGRVLPSQMIAAGQRLALFRGATGISLNNMGTESVSLLDPSQTLVDTVSFADAIDGSSYSKNGALWNWTPIPTPGLVNTFPDVPPNSSTDSDPPASSASATTSMSSGSSSSSSASESSASITESEITALADSPESTEASLITIAQARAQAADTRVRFQGVVTTLPGNLARQSFYVADPTGGIQVYKNDAVFPVLQIGNVVEVEGVLSSSRGETRVRIDTQGSLTATGIQDSIVPALTTTIGESQEGQLVIIEGLVNQSTRERLVIEGSSGSITVRATTTSALNLSLIPEGARVRVTGIVSQTDENYTLLPRHLEDITILEEIAAAPATPTETLPPDLPAVATPADSREMAGTLLLGSAGVALAGMTLRVPLTGAVKNLYAKYILPRRSPGNA